MQNYTVKENNCVFFLPFLILYVNDLYTHFTLNTLHSLCRTFRKWLNASGVAREQAQKVSLTPPRYYLYSTYSIFSL